MDEKYLNILLNGFVDHQGQEIIKCAFAPFSVGTCVSIVLHERDLPTVPVQKMIWEYPPNIWEVDWNKIRPIDEGLIDKMVGCEMVFLEMMEREEHKGRLITYQERKRLYRRLLRYWNHMIEEHGITVFLSCSLPHRGRTFIIYHLCRAKGIPTLLLFHSGPLGESRVLTEDWEDFCPELGERYAELRATHTDEQAMAMRLTTRAEDYYRKHTQEKEDPPPPYYWLLETPGPEILLRKEVLRQSCRNPLLLIRQFISSLKSRCNSDYWVRWLRFRSRLRRAKRMFAFYDDHLSEPDLTKKYVYVPLHHQPECSSCPMAGAYSEQQLVVQMLHALLPEDVLLYVKEHPHQQKYFPDGRCRDISLYQDFLSIPRVRFISRSFSTDQLTKNAVAVATGTGMAGFEALFRGVPVLLFGHWSQQYAPGVFSVTTVEDCRKALHSILEEGVKPELPEVRLFLRALEDVSLHGFIDARHESSSKEEEACIRDFSAVIQKRLLEKFPHLSTAPLSSLS
jgi:hypothetical protein